MPWKKKRLYRVVRKSSNDSKWMIVSQEESGSIRLSLERTGTKQIKELEITLVEGIQYTVYGHFVFTHTYSELILTNICLYLPSFLISTGPLNWDFLKAQVSFFTIWKFLVGKKNKFNVKCVAAVFVVEHCTKSMSQKFSHKLRKIA